MFKRILIPIEFGSLEEPVLRVACRLAASGADAKLLHVVTNDTTMFFAHMLDLPRFTEEARSRLATLVEEHGDSVSIDIQVAEGPIFDTILDEASTWKADSIVLGSHGRTGLKRMLLGSIAESIVRRSGLPTCIVKREEAGQRLERIMLATDLEDTSDAAHACYKDLLQRTGAKGDIVHVYRSDFWLPYATVAPTGIAVGGLPATGPDFHDQLREHEENYVRDLEKDAKACREAGLSVDAHMLKGTPWEEIADFIDKEEVDLLVIGTHARKALERVFLGSVAEKTLRTAHCPVLVVPN